MKVSLRWKILAWALVNLALIAGAVIWFLHAQFSVGVQSLLAGPTGGQLDAIARQLAPELMKRSKSDWPAALDESFAELRDRGVRVTIVLNNGRFMAGDVRELPPEVREAVLSHDAKFGGMGNGPKPGGPGGPRDKGGPGDPEGPRGPGGPGGFKDDMPPLPPDDFFMEDGPGPRDKPFGGAPPNKTKSGKITATTKFEKFMVVSSNPRLYWAGVHLDNPAGPLPYTLLLASDSIRGGGLFFDYVPWLWLGTALAVMSVLLWLPLVHILTKTLENLTKSAENIASGSFDPPQGTSREDELGRLQNAHRHMAQRLDGFVTGQKRFLGDTAHELLSPLARLEVALSILEQRASETERPTVNRTLGEVNRMAKLVRELLAFSKSSLAAKHETLEDASLPDLVTEAVEQEKGEAEIRVSIPEDLRVKAIPELLKRAVENLVRNAVRYAAADGPIIVSAAREQDEIVLRVSDSGPGVPEDALPRLFDPFFRPDTSRTAATGGTGLGLAIVKSCVEACQGRVSARNLVPRGFEVEISLIGA